MAKTAYKEKPQEIHANNLALLKERIKSKNAEAFLVTVILLSKPNVYTLSIYHFPKKARTFHTEKTGVSRKNPRP